MGLKGFIAAWNLSAKTTKILDLAYMLHKRKRLWYKPLVDDRFIRAIRLKRFLSYHMRGKITECWLAETEGNFYFCRKRKRAVPRFLINSRFIPLIQQFCYFASIDSHSQLSAYSKETHPTSRCKHVEQCHIWDDKTRDTYRFI